MPTSFEVADYFIANKDPDDELTMLKLQKLCSYAQAFTLALLGRPLFANELLAYKHGPVIHELFGAYRAAGRSPITTASEPQDTRRPFSQEELFVLETVNNYYGAYSASRLRNMSHEDFPGDFGSQETIQQADIAERFATNNVVKAIQDAY